jgi:hypothetical protein
MPAAVVMQGSVDVDRMVCSSLAAIQPTSTNQKTLFATVNLSLMHLTQNIEIPMRVKCGKYYNKWLSCYAFIVYLCTHKIIKHSFFMSLIIPDLLYKQSQLICYFKFSS